MNTFARVTFLYKGKEYPFEHGFEEDYPFDAAEFMFTEGNYACDCNRSLFIQRYCDELFPELICGDEIEMTKFEVYSQ